MPKTIKASADGKKPAFEVHDLEDMPEVSKGGKYADGIQFLCENPKKSISYDVPEDETERRGVQGSILTAGRSCGVKISTSFRVGKIWVVLTPEEREKQLKLAKKK